MRYPRKHYPKKRHPGKRYPRKTPTDADIFRLSCQNKYCTLYGKTHKNNIIRASNYGRAIWKCKACNHTFHIKDAKDIEIIEEVSEKVTEVITDPKSNVCCLNKKCAD
jgi:Zn-finger protein